jgi:uncharacterized repeat protein (TIGR03803 family)
MRPSRFVYLAKPKWGKSSYALLLLFVTTAVVLPAQTFTTLYSFDFYPGSNPTAGLVQAADGGLYGTTDFGGFFGTVFRITPSDTLTTLHTFGLQSSDPDGDEPGGLVQAANGDLYGTTFTGTDHYGGTVFKITPGGTLTTLYSFCWQGADSGCPDGINPSALVQATDGNFYGTTYVAGANPTSKGTVFKITPSGTLSTLYSFCSKWDCRDGEYPIGPLIQAINGELYGTTLAGGASRYLSAAGTVFKITTSGDLQTIYSFGTRSDDGAEPQAGLVQATNGDLYGTTYAGGAYEGGTVFKITPRGKLTTLYSFCSQRQTVGAPICLDGQNPSALIQASDGNFYGTTDWGGINDSNYGTIFKMTPGGALTTLYSFCSQSNCADGANPLGLVQDTNGTLYGTTYTGGANYDCWSTGKPSPEGYSIGCGTVFSLSVGLDPFVETQTTSGEVGASVRILGTDLRGATSVTFNGTAATFKVVSSSEITTTVPAGATTGPVEVVTPAGTLASNVNFRVNP